jgi:hypothetical protein
MSNKFNVGDMWMWTRNSAEHPNDPDYNYFLIVDDDWGYKVLYIKDGRYITYAKETFINNKDYLVQVG